MGFQTGEILLLIELSKNYGGSGDKERLDKHLVVMMKVMKILPGFLSSSLLWAHSAPLSPAPSSV